jgi:hypothetical protein
MNRVKKNNNLLELVATSKKKLRNSIIKGSDKEFIYSICECILNVMNGNIKLDKKTFDKLKVYKQTFKKLLKKSKLNEKKNLIVQKGGFLEFLIPAVISGISSIVSSLIEKNKE